MKDNRSAGLRFIIDALIDDKGEEDPEKKCKKPDNVTQKTAENHRV